MCSVRVESQDAAIFEQSCGTRTRVSERHKKFKDDREDVATPFQSLFSPDLLAPPDFVYFIELKGHRFGTVKTVQTASTGCRLQEAYEQHWKETLQHCVDTRRSYFEKF